MLWSRSATLWNDANYRRRHGILCCKGIVALGLSFDRALTVDRPRRVDRLPGPKAHCPASGGRKPVGFSSLAGGVAPLPELIKECHETAFSDISVVASCEA